MHSKRCEDKAKFFLQANRMSSVSALLVMNFLKKSESRRHSKHYFLFFFLSPFFFLISGFHCISFFRRFFLKPKVTEIVCALSSPATVYVLYSTTSSWNTKHKQWRKNTCLHREKHFICIWKVSDDSQKQKSLGHFPLQQKS